MTKDQTGGPPLSPPTTEAHQAAGAAPPWQEGGKSLCGNTEQERCGGFHHPSNPNFLLKYKSVCVTSSPPPNCFCSLQACPLSVLQSIPSGIVLSPCLAGRRCVALKSQICSQFLFPASECQDSSNMSNFLRFIVREEKRQTSRFVVVKWRRKKRKGVPSDCCFSSVWRREEAPSPCVEIEPNSLSSLETISKNPPSRRP